MPSRLAICFTKKHTLPHTAFFTDAPPFVYLAPVVLPGAYPAPFPPRMTRAMSRITPYFARHAALPTYTLSPYCVAHCFARFDTPIQFARCVVPLRPIHTLCVARRAVRLIYARRLYRPALRSVHVRKCKIYSPAVMRLIRPSAKFNRELRRKNQEPSKAPIKFYA